MKIGILLGDDIGLEVVPECVKVLRAAAAKTGLEVQWLELPIGKRGHELHEVLDCFIDFLDAYFAESTPPLGLFDRVTFLRRMCAKSFSAQTVHWLARSPATSSST